MSGHAVPNGRGHDGLNRAGLAHRRAVLWRRALGAGTLALIGMLGAVIPPTRDWISLALLVGAVGWASVAVYLLGQRAGIMERWGTSPPPYCPSGPDGSYVHVASVELDRLVAAEAQLSQVHWSEREDWYGLAEPGPGRTELGEP